MSTPLCMRMAIPVSYLISPNPTTPVIIALTLYLSALLISTFILCYFHLRSNPPPYECHISQPLPLTNLPIRPHPTLCPSRSATFPCLISTPSLSSSLPPQPFSSPSKDSPPINKISPVVQLQHFQACPDDLPASFGLSLRITLSLLPGPILDLLVSHSFHHYLEELPMNVLYPAFSEIFPPSPEPNSETTWSRSDNPSHLLLPYPWPSVSHPHPPHLQPLQ